MNGPISRIPQVELEHYNYKKDIANRMLISSLNTFELEMLREIVYSSLKFPLKELLTSLHVDIHVIEGFLSRLVEIGLLKLESGIVFVDKDLRRFFEFQLSKFDGDFEPNVEYVQTLLQQVPIHVLPLWYALPKNTDGIFQSIIEKHVSTPKIYSKYLQELVLTNPKQQGILRDVLSSKELSLPTSLLKKKYNLTHYEFFECMLFLEYSLACFCVYEETEHGFEERVVPLHEWKAWLQFQANTHCKALNAATIARNHHSDFGFVEDMTKVAMDSAKEVHIPIETLVAKLSTLSLIDLNGKPTASGKEWISKPPQEKSMIIYLNMMNRLRRQDEGKFTDKDIREIEKSLKRVLKTGWVLLDDFFKGMHACIGETGPVELKKQGKRWSFAIPCYKEAEREFISKTIMNFLFESGVTATGTFEGKPCFSLTPFGQITIGD